MLTSPANIRLMGSVVLIICATVVLGISAHVENAIRSLDLSTKTFTYDAFVGAFTILVELGMLVLRLLKRDTFVSSVAGELGASGLLGAFWLVAGIATTILTSEGRSFCRHLDDLFDLPELEDLDPAHIAAAKKILSSACTELHAELAFVWIGFVVLFGVTAYLVSLPIRKGRAVWKLTLHRVGAPQDPFQDPQGSQVGPTIGVAGYEEEDEEPGSKSPPLHQRV